MFCWASVLVFLTVGAAEEDVDPAAENIAKEVAELTLSPHESPSQYVGTMYLGCVAKSCMNHLMACRNDDQDCAMRLKCAYDADKLGHDDHVKDCFRDLTFDLITDHEVKIFDCAHKQLCVRPGHEDGDGNFHRIPTSLIEEQMKARNLEPMPTMHDSVEETALLELKNVLAEHSEDQVRDAVTIAKTIVQHHQSLDAVEHLIAMSEGLLKDVEAGKAGTGHESNEKLFQMLGSLEGAARAMESEAERKAKAAKEMKDAHAALMNDELEVEVPDHPEDRPKAPVTKERFLEELAKAF